MNSIDQRHSIGHRYSNSRDQAQNRQQKLQLLITNADAAGATTYNLE